MQRYPTSRLAGPGTVAGLVLVLAGCASHPAKPITGRELVELDDAWAAHAAGGDIEAAMAFWTEDATVFPEGEPPLYGKRAIRDFLERSHGQPGCRTRWTPTCAGIDPAGATAYTLGEYRTVRAGDAATAAELTGRYVAIWRKEDGAWRCAVKCWNTSPLENRAASP